MHRALDRRTRSRRVGDANRSFEFELGCTIRQIVRAQSAQQAVQNDAERVDVARSRDRAARICSGLA